MFSSVCVAVKSAARLRRSPRRTLRQSTPSSHGTLERATANFTASNAELAAGIGCIGNLDLVKAHMSKSNIAAILTVASAERDVDVFQMPILQGRGVRLRSLVR
jgi:hypothetical protein